MREGKSVKAVSADEAQLLAMCRKLKTEDQALLLNYANTLVKAEEAARLKKESSFSSTDL